MKEKQTDLRGDFDRERDLEIGDQQLAYDGFYKLRQLRLRHRRFDGDWSPQLRRELIHRPAAVAVLLYDPQREQIALVEQFRVGAIAERNPWMLELVAGLIDADDADPEAVARREALEEAGCEIAELVPVADYFVSPGGSDEYLHLFCGRCDLDGVGGIHGVAEEGEDIRVHVLPVAAVFALLDAGQIRNAHTLMALLWLRNRHQALRDRWR
jgi:ADP-ribose pyrophosphatase